MFYYCINLKKHMLCLHMPYFLNYLIVLCSAGCVSTEVMVRDLSNQPDRSADYSSYDDKSRIESADYSSYDDKSRIESVVTVSYDDKSRIQRVKILTILICRFTFISVISIHITHLPIKYGIMCKLITLICNFILTSLTCVSIFLLKNINGYKSSIFFS